MKAFHIKKIAIGLALGLAAIYLANKVPAIKKVVGGA